MWAKVRTTAGTLACLALAVGLFPTFRAMVKGRQSTPVRAAASPSAAAREIAKAKAAFRAAPPGAQRIMVVGNSVAATLDASFKALEKASQIAVFDAGVPACGFPPQVRYPPIVIAGHAPNARGQCDPAGQAQVVDAFRPVVVFWIYDEIPRLVGTYRGRAAPPCSARFGSLYREALVREVGVLSASGARVAVTTSAYSRLFGGAAIGTDDRGDDCENALKRSAARDSHALLVDLAGFVCPSGRCRDTQNGVKLRPDGFHYQGPGGMIVARWLLDQVQ